MSLETSKSSDLSSDPKFSKHQGFVCICGLKCDNLLICENCKRDGVKNA